MHKAPNNTLFDQPSPVVSSVPVAEGQSPLRAIDTGAMRRPAFEPQHPAWYLKAALTEPTLMVTRRIGMKKILSLALFALALTTTATAWGQDNSVGTWKANVAKCRYTPAPWPVTSLTVTREAAPGGIKVTNTGMRSDGSAINTTYTAKYD